MKKELDEKLCAKYPKIFANRDKDMLPIGGWGIECDDGWYWLIDQLCGRIQSYIDANPQLKISQVVATQIKEKFGGLRFYINGGDEEINGAISFAEHLSYSICEVCGSTEHVGHITSGWIQTVCKSCFDKDKKSHQKWEANELDN